MQDNSSETTAVYDPEMRITGYDSTRAWLVAMLLLFAISSTVATMLYFVMRPRPPVSYVPLEIADADGGFEDGSDDDTPDVDAEAAPRPDASPEEIEAEVLELEESLDALADISTEAAQMLPQQPGSEVENAGVLGSSEGEGGRPLGVGGGSGGVPRAKRWLIRFANEASVDEYAKQLDYFRIELGVISPNGTMIFASDLANAVPTTREVTSGDGEDRLYFQWEGGPRRLADRQLFQKAGVNTGQSPILHFYDKNTENLLAQLEYKASEGADVKTIKRTFFDVEQTRDGYAFEVKRVVKFRVE